MTTSTYSIAFEFRVDNSKLIVPLTAEVEVHHSETYYVVKNIQTATAGRRPVLPDLKVKKEKGRWVHLDSEQESDLSVQIGKSIEIAASGLYRQKAN